MTPVQFAKEQCSNYTATGGCLGVGIHDDGRLYRFGAKAKCVLGIPGVRCQFFEECVAPMGFDDPKKHEERNEALRIYRRTASAPGFKLAHQTGRVCPSCDERELEPRRRLCYVCSDQRKREANRRRSRQSKGT